jgi:hypothetical protein
LRDFDRGRVLRLRWPYSRTATATGEQEAKEVETISSLDGEL